MRSPVIGQLVARIRCAPRVVAWAVALSAIVWMSACASTVGSISVEQIPVEPKASADEYIIGVGDVLNVQVYEPSNLSGSQKVRSDGKITISLLNEFVAAGKTPIGLAGEIATSLKELVIVPRVTIVVSESSPLTVLVLGEVGRAGMQTLPRDAGVAQALAAAGGLSAFGHKNRIYVTRPGQPERIRFSYDDLLRGVGNGASFRLRQGDSIVVE